MKPDAVPASKAKLLLFFVLVGPLIGVLPLALLMAIAGTRESSGPLLGVLPFIFAHIYGSLPALLAGTVFTAASSFGPVRMLLHRRSYAFLLGAGCGVAGGVLTLSLLSWLIARAGRSWSVFVDLAILLLPCAFAGGVLGIIAPPLSRKAWTVQALVDSRAGQWILAILVLAAFFALAR
jgi:hypothetical protein